MKSNDEKEKELPIIKEIIEIESEVTIRREDDYLIIESIDSNQSILN